MLRDVVDVQVQCIVGMWKCGLVVARSSDFSKAAKNLFLCDFFFFYLLQNDNTKVKTLNLANKNHCWARFSLCAAGGHFSVASPKAVPSGSVRTYWGTRGVRGSSVLKLPETPSGQVTLVH